jgi:thymidylate synthase (FAD)
MKNKKNNKVKVLDKGFIRLIDLMGNDMSIINAARISYQKHFKHTTLTTKDKELLNFLASHNH